MTPDTAHRPCRGRVFVVLVFVQCTDEHPRSLSYSHPLSPALRIPPNASERLRGQVESVLDA